jgi:hypothetical protein
MTSDPYHALREHLLYLLRGGGAHVDFDKATAVVQRGHGALAVELVEGASILVCGASL